MDNSIEISLEQEFSQRSFETLVAGMSHEQALEFLVKLHKQMLIREATYRSLMRSSMLG